MKLIHIMCSEFLLCFQSKLWLGSWDPQLFYINGSMPASHPYTVSALGSYFQSRSYMSDAYPKFRVALGHKGVVDAILPHLTLSCSENCWVGNMYFGSANIQHLNTDIFDTKMGLWDSLGQQTLLFVLLTSLWKRSNYWCLRWWNDLNGITPS